MDRLVLVALVLVGCGSEKKKESAEKKPEPPPVATPTADAAPDEWAEARMDMVDKTIVRRGITDERVITAMRVTPRHEFVPPDIRYRAYEDNPLPIGFDKTISQAFIVATMTEAAHVKPGDKVLEIGTGSGYQAAVLALMGAKVYTMEIHPQLAARTGEVFKRLGYSSIHLKVGDGFYGWPEEAPFDAILVTCAAPSVPKMLVGQLKVGGRMVIPLGDEVSQTLDVITRATKDHVDTEELMDVRFGPMIGEIEKK
jgi:protein-L-isoaspartate(D-aspartate) O-methyltransferase